ncbi:MAG: EamA family transporter [Herpetosiphonaceae bacterium]|nr:EamA family transporter [Herpetosiphonaceae bacterium]
MDTNEATSTTLRALDLPHALERPSRRWLGYGLVLLAGGLWACLGLFFRALQSYNLPPTAIALNRAAVAGLTLLLWLALRQPAALRLRRRDLPYFAAYSVVISAFFLVYVAAVNQGSVALASVLLYTAPVWVVLFARIRWGEPLTSATLLALGLAVGGSALVALGGGALDGGGLAILLGLLSGLAYAVYSLLSNEGLRRGYPPTGIVLYAMLGGALVLLPFQDWDAVGRAFTTPGAWPALLAVGWVSSLLAPVCYAAGQQRIGASTAGILATVEPVIAALLAWILLGETLAALQLLGGASVLAAVIVLTWSKMSSRDEIKE